MKQVIKFLLTTTVAMAMLHGSAFAAPQPEGDGQVVTPNVYLRAQVGEPWDEPGNDDAMNSVFGTDDWDGEFFETVNTGTGAGGLFSPNVRFIFLDGSDSGAEELEAFLAANEAALQAFVARGGRLIVNSAPNEGDGMSYDARQIVYESNGSTQAAGVEAADGSHPIFNGPFTPAGTTFTGNEFGHSLIQGSVTPLILRTAGGEDEELEIAQAPDPSAIVLGEYRGSCGITLIGGMTTPNFHDPEAEARNLRANILHYAANTALPSCATTTVVAGSAPAPTAAGPSECVRRPISLVTARVRGRNVVLTGLVQPRFAGQTVTVLANTKPAGAGALNRLTTVRADSTGRFTARVRRPRRKDFVKTRYRAQVSRFRSIPLKLPQSLESTSISARGQQVELRGKVKRSLLGRRNPVLIERLICGRYRVVTQTKPDRGGRYVARFSVPAGVTSALFRARARVLNNKPGSRRYVTQYARAISITLTGQTG